jgi:myb proto-oncogene protein
LGSLSGRHGPWTKEEDDTLANCISGGVTKWSKIAAEIPGRNGKQCRDRWLNHLDPNIKKGGWSELEDKTLVDAHDKLGNRWCDIAKLLPGKSDQRARGRWTSLSRTRRPKHQACCVHVDVDIDVATCMCTHTHVYACYMHVRACVRACIDHVHLYQLHTQTNIHIQKCTHAHVRMYFYTCMHVCASCTPTHLCPLVRTHTHTDRALAKSRQLATTTPAARVCMLMVILMLLRACVHAYTHTHTYIHVYITCMRACVCVHALIMYICTNFTHKQIYTYTNTHVYMYMCISIYIHVRVCITRTYIFMPTCTHTHTHICSDKDGRDTCKIEAAGDDDTGGTAPTSTHPSYAFFALFLSQHPTFHIPLAMCPPSPQAPLPCWTSHVHDEPANSEPISSRAHGD